MWNDKKAYDGLGQDVGAMVEARNALEWEKQNADGFNWAPAKSRADEAVRMLSLAVDSLFSAADEAKGTERETELENAGNGAEDLVCEIRAIIRRMEGKSA